MRKLIGHIPEIMIILFIIGVSYLCGGCSLPLPTPCIDVGPNIKSCILQPIDQGSTEIVIFMESIPNTKYYLYHSTDDITRTPISGSLSRCIKGTFLTCNSAETHYFRVREINEYSISGFSRCIIVTPAMIENNTKVYLHCQ